MIAFLLASVFALGPETPVDVPRLTTHIAYSVSAATGGNVINVAWIDDRSGTRDVMTARLSSDLQLLDVKPLTNGANALNTFAVFDGHELHVVWDRIGDEWRLLDAAPIANGGALRLERSSSRLALRAEGSDERDVFDDGALTGKVLSNVVVWMSLRGSTVVIYAQQLDASGHRIGLPSQIGTTTSSTHLAKGSGFVAYQADGGAAVFRVAQNGLLTPAANIQFFPTIENILPTDNGGFILVAGDLYRFNSEGTRIATEHVANVVVYTAIMAGGRVVAFGPDIVSAQLAAATVSGEAIDIAPAFDAQTNPAIASDGSDVLTLWKGHGDVGIGSAIPALSFDRDHYNAAFTFIDLVRVAKLGRGGTFLEPLRDVGYNDGPVSLAGSTAVWRNLLIQNRVASWNFDTETAGAPDPGPGVRSVAVGDASLAAISVFGDVIVLPAGGTPRIVAHATGDALAISGDLLIYQAADGLDALDLSSGARVHLSNEIIGQPAIAHAGRTYFATWATSEGVFVLVFDGHSAEIQPVSAGARNPAITLTGGGAVIAYDRAVKELGYTARVFTRTLTSARRRGVTH
ncbi:MAG TPA: hypothetical protein VII75_14855 [Thermoanaerobaculia bacterium]|nr:hypothetical protein [Thermoanaerobaculia bacterium]